MGSLTRGQTDALRLGDTEIESKAMIAFLFIDIFEMEQAWGEPFSYIE